MIDYYLEELKQMDQPPDPWYVHLCKVLVGFAAALGGCIVLAKVISS